MPAPSALLLPEGPATPPKWELDESQFENLSDSGGSDAQLEAAETPGIPDVSSCLG